MGEAMILGWQEKLADRAFQHVHETQKGEPNPLRKMQKDRMANERLDRQLSLLPRPFLLRALHLYNQTQAAIAGLCAEPFSPDTARFCAWLSQDDPENSREARLSDGMGGGIAKVVSLSGIDPDHWSVSW